jgi:anti-sigma regulatory factor (Ser/Thr protein kinase)
VFYPTFYPEKELLTSFQHAKTPAEQMDAAGVLALHYKSKFQDSLSFVYLRHVYRISSSAVNKKLLPKALWWDAQVSAGSTAYEQTKQVIAKANNLLNFAIENKLYREAIAAKILLSDINIHRGLKLSEQYALDAKQLLDQWPIDSTVKDSLKLEVYYRLAHVSIHKKEGEKAAQNLLEQQTYAQQNRNKALKIQAVNNLAQLYWEWPGQEENARQWTTNLYNYYKEKGQKNRLFIASYVLAEVHLLMKDTASAIRYVNEAEQLQENLEIYTAYMYWLALKKRALGLLTDKDFIKLLDNRFHNRLLLPLAAIDLHKAAIYMKAGRLDSAGYYLSQAKQKEMDSLGSSFGMFDYLPAQYHLQSNNYMSAIQAFDGLKRKAEEQGDRDKYGQALMGLSKAYEGKGDYRTANAILNRYYQVRDSLNKLNYNAKIAFMEVQKEKIQVQNERKLNRELLDKHWLYSIIIIISLISIGIYFIDRYRLRQAQLRNQLAREKTDKLLAETGYQHKLNELTFSALRSQMNPHFIFNALNTIQGFVYFNDKKSASGYLGKFSQLIRKILDNSEKQTITLEEEIEILRLYTDIEKARFGESFHVQINIDHALDLENIHIPPMLIQPYVENSIKHGVFHKQGNKILLLRITKTENQEGIEVVIDDNGVGRERSKEINKSRIAHHSFATVANEKRIDLINQTIDKKTKLTIIDKVNNDGSSAGTTVIITIPMLFVASA